MFANAARAHFVPALLPGDAILIGPEGFQFGRWRAGLPDEPVLRTYLAIACRRPLDDPARGALDKALKWARAGDLTLANICLAQAGLAHAIGPEGLPARLAATEWLLDCGMTPDDVLAALDLVSPPPFTKPPFEQTFQMISDAYCSYEDIKPSLAAFVANNVQYSEQGDPTSFRDK